MENVSPIRGHGHGVSPPVRIALAVREALARDGAATTAARLGISAQTATKIAARLPVRESSIVCAAHRLGLNLDGVES
jgi:uncharacterized membrane protein